MNNFTIDIADLVAKCRHNLNKRVVGLEITAPPGITFVVEPHDPEVTAARKIVIFLRDRRVLNASECCDNCIDHSLASLGKIREYLVGQQQELANLSDGILYLMTEFILDAIRQFMTYSEHLERDYEPSGSSIPDLRRHPQARAAYLSALNRLRRHISDTLFQVRLIAGEDPQMVPENLRFKGWDAESYGDAVQTTINT